MSGILKWASADGHFRRQVSQFRDTISPDGRFPPAANRYHLYVSLACPWAHRCLLVRALKGLQSVISVSIVDYLMLDEGWKFNEETEGCIPDPIFKAKYLKDIYHAVQPDYEGRYTVPVLLDKESRQIVNNESAEIVRILNEQFNQWATNAQLNLTPSHLLPKIDEYNEWIYDQINNGVYKAGFATKQEAYEENAVKVGNGLKRCNEILSWQPFILGTELTETDIRLFTTVLRHDPVYFGHFKCNLVAVKDLPHLLAWLKRICAIPGVMETINMTHIKRHYYMSHRQINPTQIVPLSNGPDLTQ